jgi:hypothetical protein
MRREGTWCIGAGLVATLLAIVWCWARLSGALGGPDEHLAEILLCLLPPLLLATGVLSLQAAANDELSKSTPRCLQVRLSTNQGEERWRRAPALFAVSSALAFALVFSFVVSLFPRPWSEALQCGTCGDGEGQCCDLVDGQWYQWLLFAACCLVVPLYGLGGPVVGIAGLRYLRRRRQVPLPVVELSSPQLLPGSRLDLCVVVHGIAPFRRLRVGVQCLENASYPSGSSTSTDTHVAFDETVEERRDFRLPKGRPLMVTRSWIAPTGAMHSFSADNNKLEWRLAIALETRSVLLREHFGLVMLSQPEASGAWPPPVHVESSAAGGDASQELAPVHASGLALDSECTALVAGSVVAGNARLPPGWRRPYTAVSLVLVWTTEGKGERDRGQVSLPLFPAGPSTPPEILPFELRMPAGPWSYDGVLIKIRWTMQLFAGDGTERALPALPFLLLSPYLTGSSRAER